MDTHFDAKRELYINARSLILKALDLMDKAYRVGKYKSSTPAPSSSTDTFSGIIDSSPRVDGASVEQTKR
jgi:hypothetical protein